MVCYARPASILAALTVVAYLVFGKPVGHFFDTAAIAVAVIAATGGAAVVAALVFATFMSTRRRRAAVGGCVSCKFQCQHAMTGPARKQASPGQFSRRLWLVTTADRGAPGLGADSDGGTADPDRSGPVFLPMPSVGPAHASAPCWPDRPVYRTGHASQRVGARAGAAPTNP